MSMASQNHIFVGLLVASWDKLVIGGRALSLTIQLSEDQFLHLHKRGSNWV